MRKRRLFLQWLLGATMIATALAVGVKLDCYSWLSAHDRTGISFGIVAVCVIATITSGRLAWRADRELEASVAGGTDQIADLFASVKHHKMAAQLCQMLGLLGTVIGLVLALETFGQTAEVDTAAVRDIVGSMATAFVTTMAGIVAYILIWIQYHLIETPLETNEVRRASR